MLHQLSSVKCSSSSQVIRVSANAGVSVVHHRHRVGVEVRECAGTGFLQRQLFGLAQKWLARCTSLDVYQATVIDST